MPRMVFRTEIGDHMTIGKRDRMNVRFPFRGLDDLFPDHGAVFDEFGPIVRFDALIVRRTNGRTEHREQN